MLAPRIPVLSKRDEREEALLELGDILQEKLMPGGVTKVGKNLPGVPRNVMKRWSSLGVPVDLSRCASFKQSEGLSNIILVPQLETVIIEQTEVFQDYKPFYQRDTMMKQLKQVLRKHTDLAGLRVYARVRWSTADQQNVPVTFTTFRLTYPQSS